MPEADNAPDQNLYDVILLSLGDELDGTLQNLLEPLGKSIAKWLTDSPERIATFKKRYGNDEIAQFLAKEEEAVVEDFLGVAFEVAQTAYVTAVVSRLTHMHQVSLAQDCTELTTTDGSKRGMLRHGFRPAPKSPYSRPEIVDAFANYYKHREEWGPDWGTLTGKQQETARIISSAGAHQSSPMNLRTGAKYLGNPKYSEVTTLVKVLSPWREALVRAYREEIRSKLLR